MIDSKQEVFRDQIYERLGDALRSGQYVPGEKIKIRALAEFEKMSPTPVREALYRLVSDGVLEAEANRSPRVPLMTGEQVRELCDIRLALEGLAAERAALHSTPDLVARLRSIASELRAAREQGDVRADLAKIYEYQFGLYRACEMPALMLMIERLWLRSGPYLNLLVPGYTDKVKERRGDWREKICVALERQDACAVRREIELDITEALGYVAEVLDGASALRRSSTRFSNDQGKIS